VPTYLYGLLLARNSHLVPAHITGIGGAPVRVLCCDEIDALVSTLAAKPAARIDEVRAHDHALQSVVHHGATAAATRFGQTFSTDEEARRHVTERAARLARVLDTYDGCVEMRVLARVEGRSPQPPASEPADESLGEGARYLRELSRRVSPRDLSGELGVRAKLGAFVRAERVEEIPKSRAVAYSHLVPREEEQRYRDAIGAIVALERATIVGPLALYSFAAEADTLPEPGE
jgi:hypothetical protein